MKAILLCDDISAFSQRSVTRPTLPSHSLSAESTVTRILVSGSLSHSFNSSLKHSSAGVFAPYKIVWEAYGRNTFKPLLVFGRWQVNQSLQTYIPVWSKQEALELLEKLKNPVIEKYLLSMKMGKTMNWAQPGKIKKLLNVSG